MADLQLRWLTLQGRIKKEVSGTKRNRLLWKQDAVGKSRLCYVCFVSHGALSIVLQRRWPRTRKPLLSVA